MRAEVQHCRSPHCTEHVVNSWDVCDICWEYRSHWRDGMAEQYLRASQALAPGGKPFTQRVASNPPESDMPLRMGPLMAMEYALIKVDMWADTMLRRGCPGRLPERGKARDTFIFLRCLEILTNSDHELAGGPLAGDYYTDLYQAYWRLYLIDRHGLEVVRLGEPCPACDRTSMMERHAGEYVQCLTCASVWSQAAWAIRKGQGTT